MTIPSNELLIGYDYDAWYGFGDRVPVTVDAEGKNGDDAGEFSRRDVRT